jgi:hypothetical protein
MTTTLTKVATLIALGMLALGVQGCDKMPYSYRGKFPAVPNGATIEITAVQFDLLTQFPAGTVQISGQYTPLGPGALPTLVQVFILQTQPGGAIVGQVAFNLTVQPGGIIPNQLMPTPATTLEPGQELRFLLRPVGANLPFGQLKLKLLYEG